MSDTAFERAVDLVGELRDLDAAARAARIAEECGDDAEMRAEVESLLEHADGAGSFLEAPAAGPETGGLLAGFADSLGEIPDTVGPYRIVRRIGSGGMGAVYEAEQDHPRRRVALKMIQSAVVTPEHLKRFQREAELLGRLQHAGIARIYDAGTFDLGGVPQPYFAMELVEGRPLTRYAREEGLGVRARLELFARVCDAVHHAHQKGVVHRDLKPDNVLVTEERSTATGVSPDRHLGQPKVLDFGVARATDADVHAVTLQTGAGQLVGTVPYMSPEQVAGDPGEVGVRSDVYALGVCLFELLSDRLPHDLAGRSIPEAVRIIREEDPRRLSSVDVAFRGDVETIVSKALDKEPGRRYGSAAELAADIARHLRDEPIQARPASTLYQLKKFARRHRALVGGVVSTVVVLLAGVAVATVLALRAERNARAATRSAYRSSIEAAAARGLGDPLAATSSLARAPAALRGWEWSFLDALHDPLLERTVLGAPVDDPDHADVAYAPGGVPVAARRSAERTIDVLRADTGDLLARAEAPGEVFELRIARDGSRLAALTQSPARLVVWDLPAPGAAADAAPPVRLDREASDGRGRLLLARDGGLAGVYNVTPREETRVRVFDVATGDPVLDLPADCRGLGVFDGADGPVLAGWSREAPAGNFVRDARGRALLEIVGQSGAAAFCADGSRLALAIEERGTTKLYVVAPGSGEVLLGTAGLRRGAASVALSPDGRTLAAADHGTEVQVWDVETGAVAAAFPADAYGLAFDPAGGRIAAATPAGAAVWDVGGVGPRVLEHEGFVYQAAFSPDGRLLATGGEERVVRVFDAWTGEPVASFDVPWVPTFGVAFSADGRSLVACRGQKTRSWDLADAAAGPTSLEARETGPDTKEYGAARGFWSVARGGSKSIFWDHTNGLATSADGRLFAHATGKGVCVLRTGDGRVVAGAPQGDRVPSRAVAFSPDGEHLAVADELEIQLLETRTLRPVRVLRGSTGNVLSVDFSPDGTRLAAGGRDRKVRIWDPADPAPLLSLEGHGDYVHAVEWSPDGSRIASASGDGTVRLWDASPAGERRRRVEAAAAARAALEPEDAEELGARLEPGAATPEVRAAALRLLIDRASGR